LLNKILYCIIFVGGNMKKLLLGILCALSLSMLNVKAAEETPKETPKEKINVYVFTKDGCPYCEKAKTFLNSITDEYGKYFNLVVYEVYDAEWNANENLKNAMDTVAKEFGDKVNGVPYIVIGDEASWPGYQSAFDDDIKKAIKKAYENEDYKDIVAPLINSSIGEKKDEHSNDTIITVAILVVLVGGIGSLVYFSRKKQK
jgi:glutaredoxin